MIPRTVKWIGIALIGIAVAIMVIALLFHCAVSP